MKESYIEYAETDLSRCQRLSSHMKLAFSTLGCPDWNIETVAEAVVRYGYDAVEWRVVDGSILSPGTPEHTLHRLVTLTREYHLSVAALDTSCPFLQVDAAARGRTPSDAPGGAAPPPTPAVPLP